VDEEEELPVDEELDEVVPDPDGPPNPPAPPVPPKEPWPDGPEEGIEPVWATEAVDAA